MITLAISQYEHTTFALSLPCNVFIWQAAQSTKYINQRAYFIESTTATNNLSQCLRVSKYFTSCLSEEFVGEYFVIFAIVTIKNVGKGRACKFLILCRTKDPLICSDSKVFKCITDVLYGQNSIKSYFCSMGELRRISVRVVPSDTFAIIEQTVWLILSKFLQFRCLIFV